MNNLRIPYNQEEVSDAKRESRWLSKLMEDYNRLFKEFERLEKARDANGRFKKKNPA